MLSKVPGSYAHLEGKRTGEQLEGLQQTEPNSY